MFDLAIIEFHDADKEYLARPTPRDTRPPPRGARFDRYEPELDR